MRAETDFAALSAVLSATTGSRFAPAPVHSVGGGCINDCYRWQSADGPCFVKLGETARLPMFEAEADGLESLAACRAVRVPRVLAAGQAAHRAFLALEWIERGAGGRRSEALLGERLAAQHRNGARLYGWHRDNTIGLTPQKNRQNASWIEFFRECRLRFQLELAERNGFAQLRERGARLLDALPALLAGHEPEPSLLHGDLWGGNWFADTEGAPVIFDPAVYYGDREADLAMTHLFGGFGEAFCAAYRATWPLDPGYEQRRELYNLYHVLNHANLFGGGYARQAAATIDRLLAAVGA